MWRYWFMPLRSTKKDIERIVRFLVAGGCAALTEYIAYVTLLYGIHAALIFSQPFSFAVGLIVSYLLNKHLVFRAPVNTKKQLTHQILPFLGLGLFNMVVTTVIIGVIVDVLNINELIAKLIIMALVAVWNYLIFSRVIFR